MPPDHVNDPEGRRYRPVLVPVELAVDRLVREEDVPADGTRLAAQDGVSLAHELQVLHQLERVWVVDDDVVHVDRQHLEAGLLQQAADVPHVGERGHAGGHAAPAVLLGQLQRRPQLEERVPAEHGPDEGAVRLEDVVDLGEHAGEVVDPVQAEVAQDQVEGRRLERQALLVVQDLPRDGQALVEGQVRVAVQLRVRRVGGDQLGDAARERRGGGLRRIRVWVLAGEGARDVARVRAEVEGAREVPLDVLRWKGEAVSALGSSSFRSIYV